MNIDNIDKKNENVNYDEFYDFLTRLDFLFLNQIKINSNGFIAENFQYMLKIK